jgi:hypothetical protein
MLLLRISSPIVYNESCIMYDKITWCIKNCSLNMIHLPILMSESVIFSVPIMTCKPHRKHDVNNITPK